MVKAIVAIGFVLALCVAVSASKLSSQEVDLLFNDFTEKYNKEYEHAGIREFRKAIFHKNLEFINAHNTLGKSYTVGINEFADMTHEEFKSQYLRPIKLSEVAVERPLHVAAGSPPASWDWRTKNAVTKIKNQGQCGSCWAFSTTGAIEGAWAVAGKGLISLSEQQLMDCSTSYGNQGCDGGLPSLAAQYVIDNKGIELESAYPYKAEDGNCHFKSSKVAATISSYTNITSGDEDNLEDAVASEAPVSVGIDASQPSFQFYTSGVYNEPNCSSDQLDHGVLTVGYGTSNGQAYWIVKNSWGTSWGQNGYIWMCKDCSNQCGIATMAIYATAP